MKTDICAVRKADLQSDVQTYLQPHRSPKRRSPGGRRGEGLPSQKLRFGISFQSLKRPGPVSIWCPTKKRREEKTNLRGFVRPEQGLTFWSLLETPSAYCQVSARKMCPGEYAK